jgi:hypothetical protein
MRSEIADRLLLGGLVGPPLFVAVALIEGATRPGYDPIRHPLSLLALGEWGWIQSTNFVGLGALAVAFVLGLGGACPVSPGRLGLGRP